MCTLFGLILGGIVGAAIILLTHYIQIKYFN